MADIRNVEMARELLALDDLEISLGAIKNAINVCVDKESKEAMLPIAEKLAAKVEKAKKEFNEKWN